MSPKTTRRDRGSGGLYQRASDGLWCASVDIGWDAQGKRKRRVVTSKTQAGALKKLRELQRTLLVHGTVPTDGLTVHQWLQRWRTSVLPGRALKPKTIEAYTYCAGLIDEAIGKTRMDKLTAAHVRRVNEHARAGRGEGTARQVAVVFRKAVEDARREGVVVRNVALDVDLPPKPVTTGKALTLDQARTLLRQVEADPLAARWALALIYGVRQGEALGLRWSAVDVDAGVIDLSWALQEVRWAHGCTTARPCGLTPRRCPKRRLDVNDGVEVEQLHGTLCLLRPKHNRQRILPLTDDVVRLLEHRARVAAGQPNPHGLVFAHPDGRPIAPSVDWAAYKRHLEAAGLPLVKLHEARHTAATLLDAQGVPEATIQAIVGHSDAVTTRRYVHADLTRARAAIDAQAKALTSR